MRRLWDDLRIALRSLSKARGFSVAVISTLALGIALETSVIAVVNAYLIRSLPYPASSRLYQVSYAREGEDTPAGLADLNWQSASDVIEHPIAWDLDVFYLIGGDHPERAPGAWVTSGFMHGLGIQPKFGRAFTADEFIPGGPQVALISDALWRGRFGADSAILGQRFDAYVSDRPNDPAVFTVVGVLPENFWHVNTYTEVLTPLRAATYPYFVRLRAGVPPALAESRLTQLVREGGAQLPANRRIELQSVHERYASRVRPLLVAIATSVSLVLLIACANVAFLVLIRGMRRQKEVALRIALGAGRLQVGRMLVTESLILAGVAALAGTALAWLVTRQLADVIGQQLGRPAPGGPAALSVDLSVIVIISALTLLIAVLLTLAPLLLTSRQALFSMMRRGKQSGAEGSRARRTRFALIALEVAGSLALLSSCGLMVRTVLRMLDIELGMQPAGVVTATLAIRDSRYPDAASRLALYERLLGTLSRTPGVGAAALSFPPPLAEYNPQRIRTDAISGAATSLAGVVSVTPDYFTALSIGLVQGRLFTPLDRAASEPVAVVSETAARRLWPNASAIGRSVTVLEGQAMSEDSGTVGRAVVGVVSDVRHSPTDEQVADVYVPLLQTPGRFSRIVLRTTGVRVQWLTELRRVLKEIDPEITVGDVQPLQAAVDEQLARPRFLATLFASFGLFATILALMGVYGVIAYAVRQREHEVAVRMAVGADAKSIMRLFMTDGALVLVAGVGLGALAALGMGRLLGSQLFGVQSLDPASLVAAALALSAACLAAIWWPARRATGTDPVIALREE